MWLVALLVTPALSGIVAMWSPSVSNSLLYHSCSCCANSLFYRSCSCCEATYKFRNEPYRRTLLKSVYVADPVTRLSTVRQARVAGVCSSRDQQKLMPTVRAKLVARSALFFGTLTEWTEPYKSPTMKKREQSRNKGGQLFENAAHMFFHICCSCVVFNAVLQKEAHTFVHI